MPDLETNTDSQNLELSGQKLILPLGFSYWFYIIAPRNILAIWGNYLASNLHYFSVGLLLRTWVAPWHRDNEGYGRGFDLARWFRVWSMNMVSRGIGFVIRSVVLGIALGIEAFIFVFGILFLIFWLAAPLAVTAAAVVGVYNLF